jgi:hypothetical protein
MPIRKTQSHGKIGEAAVTAKCWMHGIPAYNTGGLRANFAGSDIIVDTEDPKRKLLVQVKSGYSPRSDQVYLTQCKGDEDLAIEKFVADFVVFVNIDKKAGNSHTHDGTLGFQHLIYFVVPRDVANNVYIEAVRRDHAKPLRSGGQRALANMAVNVERPKLEQYHEAWHLIRGQSLAVSEAEQVVPPDVPASAASPLQPGRG